MDAAATMLPQEMTTDALRALDFLRQSSTVWIFRLPIDTSAKPVLERAWIHYSLRMANASPQMFVNWLITMRDKNIRVSSNRQIKFTSLHFDFLLKRTLHYVQDKLSPGSAMPLSTAQRLRTPRVSDTKSSINVEQSATAKQKKSKSRKKKVKAIKTPGLADACSMVCDTTPPCPQPATVEASPRSKRNKRKRTTSETEDVGSDSAPAKTIAVVRSSPEPCSVTPKPTTSGVRPQNNNKSSITAEQCAPLSMDFRSVSETLALPPELAPGLAFIRAYVRTPRCPCATHSQFRTFSAWRQFCNDFHAKVTRDMATGTDLFEFLVKFKFSGVVTCMTCGLNGIEAAYEYWVSQPA